MHKSCLSVYIYAPKEMITEQLQDVSIASQRIKLSNLLKNNCSSLELKANAHYYIVATSWIIMFKQYIDFDMEDNDSSSSGREQYFPGAIDSSFLSDNEDAHLLRKGLEEGQDYTIVPKEEYEYLRTIYGDNQLSFLRTALEVPDGHNRTYISIDLRPYKVRVWTCNKDGGVDKQQETPNVYYLKSKAVLEDLAQKNPSRQWLQIKNIPSYISQFEGCKRDIIADFRIIDDTSSPNEVWRILVEPEDQQLAELVDKYCGVDARCIDVLLERPLHNGYQLTHQGTYVHICTYST